jgi:hypothetical protein
MQRRAAVAGRLFDAVVLAPIGAGAKLLTDTPGAVARVRQELANARFIGEMVVGQGAAQLHERLAPAPDSATTEAAPAADAAPVRPVADVPPTSEVPPVVDESAGDDALDDDSSSPEAVVDTDELAIPDYDSLPAIDIVGQLESLSPAELSAVETYERANRRRRTVLGKISQLSGAA